MSVLLFNKNNNYNINIKKNKFTTSMQYCHCLNTFIPYFCIFGLNIVSIGVILYLYFNDIPSRWYINPTILITCVSFVWGILAFIYQKCCDIFENKATTFYINRMDKKYYKLIPECCICMLRPQSVVFNCGHSGICHKCVKLLIDQNKSSKQIICHMCRVPVTKFNYGVYEKEEYNIKYCGEQNV